MPRFAHPLRWQLTNTDENAPGPSRITMRAIITVEVEDRAGDWRRVEVIVDTGASYPMMGTHQATAVLNLAVPPPAGTIVLRTATGRIDVPVADGELHLRFPQLPGLMFRLKCLFRDQPLDVLPVLGLHNTVDLIKLVFDGTSWPSAGPPRPDDGFMGSMEFIVPDETA